MADKSRLKVAFVKPPIAGHKNRGVGVYTDKLYNALINSGSIEVGMIDIKSNQDKFDLVHFPYFDPFFLTLPLIKKKPTVVTIHDLIPLEYPKHFPAGIRGTIKWQIQKTSIKSCSMIITDSKASKKDILGFTGCAEDKIEVIYLGIGKNYKKINDQGLLDKVKNRLKLPDEFILHVGDVNYNKNIPGLIKAFEIIINRFPCINLILIGKGFTTNSAPLAEISQMIKKLKIDDKVRLISNIPEGDLAGVYNLAKLYLQPSFAEGFGLPVLEAMACGCVTAVSNCSSLAEITKEASASFDPNDVSDIAKICIRILSDERKRNELIQIGLKRAKSYSWDRCAKATIDVYQKICTQKHDTF